MRELWLAGGVAVALAVLATTAPTLSIAPTKSPATEALACTKWVPDGDRMVLVSPPTTINGPALDCRQADA